MPPMTHLMTYKYLLELLYCLESTTFGHSSFTTVVQIQLSTSTSSSLAFAVLSTRMEQRGTIHYTLSFVQSRAYVTFCSICQPLIPELWRDLHQHSSPVQMAISQRQAHTFTGPFSGGSNYFKLSHIIQVWSIIISSKVPLDFTILNTSLISKYISYVENSYLYPMRVPNKISWPSEPITSLSYLAHGDDCGAIICSYHVFLKLSPLSSNHHIVGYCIGVLKAFESAT